MGAVRQLNLGIKVNGKQAEETYKSITAQMYKLRREVAGTTEGTKEWEKANADLAKVEQKRDGMIAKQKAFREEVKQTTEATKDNTSAIKDFGENVSKVFSSLASGDLIGVQQGFAAIKVGIIGATKAAWAFIATPIGAGIAALAGIALITKQWLNYNQEALEANRITQQLTQLTGEALDQARIRATALEKTFGTEYKKSLEIAKNLVQAFGISYEEAFDKIENGLIRGGKENGEFLDSMKEYPKLFAQAGFTVEDFQRLVNTGIDMGIYSDKLPDAIKEFSLSVMEETTASRDALENAFGKEFTDKLFKGIQDGSITVKDALGLVAGEAENIGLNAQQAQQLTADLFRGAGEDAGGALVIFEAVTTSLIEQERALTLIESQLQETANANEKLETAQNKALKSEKYQAFANDVSLSWTKVKTGFYDMVNGITGGLITAENKLSKFRYQIRGFIGDAFSGKDADWDALGKEHEAKQAAKEKIAAQQIADAEKKEADKQKANEAAAKKSNTNPKKTPLSEEAKTKASELKKSLEALDAIEAEYLKKSEDREANSALKKAELDKKHALEKAAALGASDKLQEQIAAEHDIKINEEKAKEKEAELLRMREFDARKRELENELELAKATTEEEKAAIKAEQDLENEDLENEKRLAQFEKEMEFLKLTDEEKKAYLELMEENHQAKMQEIKRKSLEKLSEQEKKWAEASKQSTIDLEEAKINAQFAGLDVLKSIFGQKSSLYKLLFLAEQGMAAGEVITNAAKSLAAISANTAIANTAAVAASPLTGGMPWVAINTATGLNQAAAVKINAGIQLGSIAGATINGFDKGGYTDMFGMGYRDNSGEEVAGVVHTNEYVVPAIVRKDPEVPEILRYLEKKRKKALGSYANGGDVDTVSSESYSAPSTQSEDKRDIVLNKLLEILQKPIVAESYFGYEAMLKMQEAQNKLKEIEDRSKVKK